MSDIIKEDGPLCFCVKYSRLYLIKKTCSYKKNCKTQITERFLKHSVRSLSL